MESLRKNYPIQRRKIFKKTLGSMIAIAFLSVFIAFIVSIQGGLENMTDNDKTGIFVISSVLFLIVFFSVWSFIFQILYFKSYHYASDSNNIQIRKGVISRREITLPYDRVTDLYVDQDLLDRIFGLYDLHFSTATAESAIEAHIDGLDQEACNSLKDIILSEINSRKN